MQVIRFNAKGLLNSFRVPFFRTYHKSFLAPPKTTVIGMLCNISLKSQKLFFEILDRELIDISVVINNIEGKTKDLWSYKTLKEGNRGKSVIRRDKLYLPSYIIYLKIDNKLLYKEILECLKNPKNIPSLGLDDELIFISDIQEIQLIPNEGKRINSIFLDKGLSYKSFVKNIQEAIEIPTSNFTSTKFIGFNKKGERISREASEELKQVEYINCEIEFEEEVESFYDEVLNNKVIFY